jgi:hypothetical protein
VDASANLGMFQAAMRKMATFELVDGDLLKEHVWHFDEEEEDLSVYIESTGYDSRLF